MLALWGQIEVPCDFDGGGVGVPDFLQMLAHWGECPGGLVCSETPLAACVELGGAWDPNETCDTPCALPSPW